ncbi:MAG: O-antigen ligase family protein, partial [Thermoanaerobaculia bacterium]|nr:O-antigen ligase family protein [Thermoanaerobaculia bacterium]
RCEPRAPRPGAARRPGRGLGAPLAAPGPRGAHAAASPHRARRDRRLERGFRRARAAAAARPRDLARHRPRRARAGPGARPLPAVRLRGALRRAPRGHLARGQRRRPRRCPRAPPAALAGRTLRGADAAAAGARARPAGAPRRGARGAPAAAAGSLALWAGLLPRRRLLPAALALLAAGGMVVALAAPVRERVVAKARDALSGDANRLLTGRLDGWRAAVWMASERPHAGVGPGAFAAAFVPAKLALLDRGAAFFREQTNPVFANAHNELLEVGAELGLPGLAALAWGGSVLLGRLRRRRWEGGDRALAGAALVALAVLALFHFPFRLALTGSPAALLLAWVLGDPDREEPGTVSRGRARAAALGLALLFALALWPAAGRLAASRLVRAAETRTLTAVRAGLDPAARRLLEGNVAMLDDAIRKDPAAISARVALGAQHLLLGHAESAIAAAAGDLPQPGPGAAARRAGRGGARRARDGAAARPPPRDPDPLRVRRGRRAGLRRRAR